MVSDNRRLQPPGFFTIAVQPSGICGSSSLKASRGGNWPTALDKVGRDFADLEGFIVDIRDCPGGDDSTAIAIINRFCELRSCVSPADKAWPRRGRLETIKDLVFEPEGDTRFTDPSRC